MKSFKYTIKDSLGIHARPAGLLVKTAAKFQSKITISGNGKFADIKRLLAVMSLGIKCGVEVEISAEGPDEDAACAALADFFEANL